MNVKTVFHATVPNQIVSIERIQNKKSYERYNVEREAMMKKYGSNFPGKEKMLFHGTSCENVEKINADGLNPLNTGRCRKRFFCSHALVRLIVVNNPAMQIFKQILIHTAKNAQVATSLLISYNNLLQQASRCVRMACDSLLATSLLSVMSKLVIHGLTARCFNKY